MTSNSVKIESPLNQVALSRLPATAELTISEQPFMGYIIVRGKANDDAFLAACRSVLGFDLPQSANTLVSHDEVDVIWAGPSEWLLVVREMATRALVEDLQTSLAGVHSSVVDVSGGNTMVEVAGSQARALLAKGSPYDFHHSVFKLGHCVQTVLAKATATIYPIEDGNRFRIIFRRSFADYLGVWLLDASREFMQD